MLWRGQGLRYIFIKEMTFITFLGQFLKTCTRLNKRRVEVSLKTKSADKARSLSMTLSDRLERYWDSLRLEQIHSRELGLSLINADLRPNDKKTSPSLSLVNFP